MPPRKTTTRSKFTVYVDKNDDSDILIPTERGDTIGNIPSHSSAPEDDVEQVLPIASSSRCTSDTAPIEAEESAEKGGSTPVSANTGPSPGPNEGIETVQLAKAAGLQIVDFAYQGGRSQPTPFPTRFDAWKLLAFFDSQNFAHSNARETGRLIGAMPLGKLYPAKEYLKLVECGWLTEDEFDWDDAIETLKVAKESVMEKRRASKERKWYMRRGAPYGVAPTVAQRHANVLKFTDVVSTTLALHDTVNRREQSGPAEGEAGWEAIMPHPNDLGKHKNIIKLNAWRWKERKRVAAMQRLLTGTQGGDDAAFHAGWRRIQRDIEGVLESDGEDGEDGLGEGEDGMEEVGDDDVGRGDGDEEMLDVSEQNEEAARVARNSPVTQHPPTCPSPQGVTTRAQKRKLEAADREITPPKRQKVLPRAACPLPLTSRPNDSSDTKSTKRPRRSRKEEPVKSLPAIPSRGRTAARKVASASTQKRKVQEGPLSRGERKTRKTKAERIKTGEAPARRRK